ncbi:hypothetical protein M413DRAFT_370839 [Hebeloma cylindrosporum]|uniref:G domain-containing protein n=1 Tax=Hebeloma cylindrosporum TaxID=76867 RepID=A0A0C3C4U1_HEBCY|nr:hypothetical protein M413DRAFT_370839 [Hebeloma cylindrosporum h7]
MGVTGTGKSSFIRLLTGDMSVKVGDDLESETSDVQVLEFVDPETRRKVTIVDTPGFDDSRSGVTDTDILGKITEYLLKEYDQERKLNGLVYVQRVSDPRFSGQSSRNLRMFRELCGKAAYKNVVVLTTYWDQLSTHEEGVRREAQLKSKYFAALVDGGAEFMRHDRTVESARAVLRHILPIPPAVTQIQKEIRQEGKALEDTGARSVHSKEVEAALAKYKNEIANLTAEMARIQASNTAARRELELELAELRNSLAGREREQSELRKGLVEEREFRQRLEEKAEKMTAQFQRQIQTLSKADQAKELRRQQAATREAVDRALREARKQPLSRRLMDVAEDIPLLPNFLGKPILGGVGLGLDIVKGVLR